MIMALVIWAIWYLPGTPSYAVYRFHEAVSERDGPAAAAFIDFEKSIKSLVSQYTDAAGEKSDEQSAFSSMVAQGILGAMSPSISAHVKVEFEKAVEDPKSKVATVGEIGPVQLAGILFGLRRDGNMAYLKFNDRDGKMIEVTLTKEEDRWMATAISGSSVRDSIRESLEEEGKSGSSDEAKRTETQNALSELKTALDRFYLDNGFYPTTDQGLQALVSAPTSGRTPPNYEVGGYIERLPKDAWGTPYFYQSEGSRYTLKSFGPDGVESADDIDASSGRD